MEKYPPKTPEEALHPVLGNLYLSSSVKDAAESRNFRIRDILEAEKNVREHQIRARLALSEFVSGYPASIYIHGAKHSEEEHPSRRRRVPVFDETGGLLLEVPKRFNIVDFRANWESDIIVLATFDPIRRRDVFSLDLYLDEILARPKISLPSRVIKPRLPL